MERKLVWMTNSFREHSRLTSKLEGECAFVYYSPYYFAGERERQILKTCSQNNLHAFFYSINAFDITLHARLRGHLHIFRVPDVISHINDLVAKHKFDEVVIDQPLFAMWHTVDITKIKCKVTVIDSALVDPGNKKMTAKSRWTEHVLWRYDFKPFGFSKNIRHFGIPDHRSKHYQVVRALDLVNPDKVMRNAVSKAPEYYEKRDHHDGQLRLSVALHNGVLDPAEVFYSLDALFSSEKFDNAEERRKAVLRQLAFREISIIKARAHNLTLEDTPRQWAQKLMHHAAYDNMLEAKPNPTSTVTWETIKDGKTGDADLDFLINELKTTGIMPNRARMWFASKVFYESHTGLDALNSLINTFDLLGLDGQSPNNYTQCIDSLALTYGKVLKMNRDAAWQKLGY